MKSFISFMLCLSIGMFFACLFQPIPTVEEVKDNQITKHSAFCVATGDGIKYQDSKLAVACERGYAILYWKVDKDKVNQQKAADKDAWCGKEVK